MTDTEMAAQDLEDDPGVKPVDDRVQAQQNQQSDAHHQVTAGDNTLTLPSDVPMTDVQPSSHDLPDVLVSSQDKISPASNGNDVRQDKVPEQKFDAPPEDKPVLESNLGEKLPERRFGDGDGEIFERQPETATPLPLKKYPTHKSKHDISSKSKSVWTDVERGESDESGTPEERASFMKELETFYRENALEFKPPKFYGEPLNCLKLWRAVIKLGGYEVVTASKLWRQVGESFHPPKTCTTVSWTFRIFYEKALLEYEKHKRQNGELQLPGSPVHQSTNVEKETSGYQPPGSGSGRERRIAATRAMQGWHAQRLLGYGEISEPIIKDKNLNTATKREKTLKSIGIHKQKTNNMDPADKHGSNEADRELRLLEPEIVDIGPPADWVKINVRETKDCYEVYALVPGLLREEVRVQSDPAGRLVITGQPEHLDNPWGITPFKKVVVLPSRIDPLHTSAIVSLHGRLHVRVPFEQLSS